MSTPGSTVGVTAPEDASSKPGARAGSATWTVTGGGLRSGRDRYGAPVPASATAAADGALAAAAASTLIEAAAAADTGAGLAMVKEKVPVGLPATASFVIT